MRVILIRHGQTELNERGAHRGRMDVHLNPHGIGESEAVAQALGGIGARVIYCSPLTRARETALIIAARLGGSRIQELDDLIDMDFGQWQGRTIADIQIQDASAFHVWASRPEIAIIPGGESLDTVRERVLRAMQRIVSAKDKGRVIVVSHGAVNKVLLCAVLGITNAGFWHFKQDTGALSILEYQPDGARICLLNDTCHLRSLAKSHT